MSNYFFRNVRPKRSVLKRTRPRQDLPPVILYLGELTGQMQRRVMGPDGEEKLLGDKIVESNYKLVSGPEADELLVQHWPKMRDALVKE